MSQAISRLRDEEIYDKEFVAALSDDVLGRMQVLSLQVKELNEGMTWTNMS